MVSYVKPLPGDFREYCPDSRMPNSKTIPGFEDSQLSFALEIDEGYAKSNDFLECADGTSNWYSVLQFNNGSDFVLGKCFEYFNKKYAKDAERRAGLLEFLQTKCDEPRAEPSEEASDGLRTRDKL